MNLAQQQRKEAMLSIANDRDNVENVAQLILRSKCEGGPRSRQHGEDIGQGTGNIEQMLEETEAVQAQVPRKVGDHREKLVDVAYIGEPGIIRAGAVCHAQFPRLVLEPLLIYLHLG